MGQVRLPVGSCGRHAMTTGLTHTVATQGTHFHHMEMAASVNHNVRELFQRTVMLPRMEHLAGGPKRSIHATQVRGTVSCKYINGVSLHMSLTYCCHCSVAQSLPNSTVNNHLRRWPIPSFHLPLSHITPEVDVLKTWMRRTVAFRLCKSHLQFYLPIFSAFLCLVGVFLHHHHNDKHLSTHSGTVYKVLSHIVCMCTCSFHVVSPQLCEVSHPVRAPFPRSHHQYH